MLYVKLDQLRRGRKMASEIITKSEFYDLLKKQIKIKRGSESSIEFDFSKYEDTVDLLYKKFIDSGLDKEEIFNILYGAKALMRLKENEEKNKFVFVDFSKGENFEKYIKSILDSVDFRIFKAIEVAERKFKEYSRFNGLEYHGLTEIMSDFWNQSKEIYKNHVIKSSLEMKGYVEKCVEIYKTMALLFHTVQKYTDDYVSDLQEFTGTFLKGLFKNNQRIKAELVNPNNNIADSFENFLKQLTLVKDERVRFSAEEIKQLLIDTKSIVVSGTAEKWDAVSKALEDHISAIARKYNDESLKNYSAKTVLLRAGSVIESNPKNIRVLSSLLCGNKMKLAIDGVISNENSQRRIGTLSRAKEFVLSNVFPELKIQGINKETNEYILKNSVTMFYRMTTGTIYDSLNNIMTCLCRAYGEDTDAVDLNNNNIWTLTSMKKFLELKGIDMDKMLTKDNITEVFAGRPLLATSSKRKMYNNVKTIYSESLIENVKLFNNIVSSKDIQKVLQHNFSFFMQDPDILLGKVQEIAKTSKTFENFKSKIEEMLNVAAYKEPKTEAKEKKKSKENARLKKDKIEVEEFVINRKFLIDVLKLSPELVKDVNDTKPKTEPVVIEYDGAVDNVNKVIRQIDLGEFPSEEYNDVNEGSNSLSKKISHLCENLLDFVRFYDYDKELNDDETTIKFNNAELVIQKFMNNLNKCFKDPMCVDSKREECVEILKYYRNDIFDILASIENKMFECRKEVDLSLKNTVTSELQNAVEEFNKTAEEARKALDVLEKISGQKYKVIEDGEQGKTLSNVKDGDIRSYLYSVKFKDDYDVAKSLRNEAIRKYSLLSVLKNGLANSVKNMDNIIREYENSKIQREMAKKEQEKAELQKQIYDLDQEINEVKSELNSKNTELGKKSREISKNRSDKEHPFYKRVDKKKQNLEETIIPDLKDKLQQLMEEKSAKQQRYEELSNEIDRMKPSGDEGHKKD